jgi:hypothetical protein
VKAVFSTQVKNDLAAGEKNYEAVSERLASASRERVSGQVREIVKWKGGDHVGPHGFPCRRTRPFPYYIYYSVDQETIYFLGLVHERRHPDFLKRMQRDPDLPYP